MSYRVYNKMLGDLMLKNKVFIPRLGSPLGYWWIDIDTMTAEISGLKERGFVDVVAWGITVGGPSAIDDILAGENLVKGNVVYLDPSTGDAYKAIANNDIKMRAYGIASEDISVGTLGSIVTHGLLDLSGGIVAGSIYYLSDSVSGQLTSTAPTTTGSWIVQIGIGKSSMAIGIQILLHSAIKLDL